MKDSMKYDLNLGNVKEWRKRDLEKWTAQRTRIWTQMRSGGERAMRKPDGYSERWVAAGNRLFFTGVLVGGALLVEVAFKITEAFATGRVQQVLDQIVRSN